MDQTTDWNKIMIQARKALVKSLNKFGCNATLDLIIRMGDKDPVMNELLAWYPQAAVIGNFIARIPVLNTTDRKNLKNRRGNRKRR